MQDAGGFLRGDASRRFADIPGFGIIHGHFDTQAIFHQRPAAVDLLPCPGNRVPEAWAVGTIVIS